jgi:4a-hydroxytetrahydrobiopterin dehydratase
MPSLINEPDILHRLGNSWRYDKEKKMIVKEYLLPDFSAAIEFIHEIEPLAQTADHHPDILLHGYRKVRVMLTTHSAGGVTENDINLAKAIDAL